MEQRRDYPDFGVISGHLDSLSSEIRLLNNLPFVDEGQTILQRLRELTLLVERMGQQQERSLARIETALDVLKREATYR